MRPREGTVVCCFGLPPGGSRATDIVTEHNRMLAMAMELEAASEAELECAWELSAESQGGGGKRGSHCAGSGRSGAMVGSEFALGDGASRGEPCDLSVLEAGGVAGRGRVGVLPVLPAVLEGVTKLGPLPGYFRTETVLPVGLACCPEDLRQEPPGEMDALAGPRPLLPPKTL